MIKRINSVAVRVLLALLVFIGFLAYFSAKWCFETYGDIGFDAIIFTMLSSLDGVSGSLISSYMLEALLPTVIITAAVLLIILFTSKQQIILSLRSLKFKIFPLCATVRAVVSLILFVSLIINAAYRVGLPSYIKSKLDTSKIFEVEYISPLDTEIKFPDEKRNLIYIFMESGETSFFSKAQGGTLDNNVIEPLYQLAENNTNFSDNNGVGGLYVPSASGWTIAALITQTSGLPLKTYIEGNSMGGYKILPGATTIMDILSKNGYYQAFMCGSDSKFGGRKEYFLQHSTDRIYDLFTAQTDGIIPKDYYDGWWGMEDKYLYEYAKSELPKLALGDEPFALYMLTVDTHHIDGHICDKCNNEYLEQYENVFNCAARQVCEFIDWLKLQDFYENTTVVIVGDHCSMDGAYFARNSSPEYQRKVYNCFINSVTPPPEKFT